MPGSDCVRLCLGVSTQVLFVAALLGFIALCGASQILYGSVLAE